MAEDDSSQEKTEEPTTKKLEKSKEEGQVARSKEFNTLAILIAGSMGLLIFGQRFYTAGVNLFSNNMNISRADIFDVSRLTAHVGDSAADAIWALLPFFMMTLLAAFIGPAALGGWLLSPAAMAPKMSRMNPLSGLKRMFSANSLMELMLPDSSSILSR